MDFTIGLNIGEDGKILIHYPRMRVSRSTKRSASVTCWTSKSLWPVQCRTVRKTRGGSEIDAGATVLPSFGGSLRSRTGTTGCDDRVCMTLLWREPDSNHRSRVRKSGRCQVPAIRPGSVGLAERHPHFAL